MGLRWMVAAMAACLELCAAAQTTSSTTAAAFEAARLQFEIGLTHLDVKRFDDAIQAFELSLSIRESAPALYNLALAAIAVSDRERARRALTRFIELETARAELDERAEARLADARVRLERLEPPPREPLPEVVDSREPEPRSGARKKKVPPMVVEAPKQPEPIVEQWWFWVAAAAVLTAASVGLAVALKGDAEEDAGGSLGFVQEAIRR